MLLAVSCVRSSVTLKAFIISAIDLLLLACCAAAAAADDAMASPLMQELLCYRALRSTAWCWKASTISAIDRMLIVCCFAAVAAADIARSVAADARASVFLGPQERRLPMKGFNHSGNRPR